MKPRRFIITVLCLIFYGHTLGLAQDMDTELSKLSEDLAGKIKAHGCKKVTVLDFTDLQGGSSELGKYIAEQLTVDFVMTNRDFAVLDRANLKSILAEHKLTATGLINPENAKKLGLFAGVDALIIGNIIPVGTNINLTVKIITTETAEVVGGAKAKFKSDDTVQQFLSKPAQADNVSAENTSGESQPPAPPPPKPFGDLQAKVKSVQLLSGDNIYGYARLTLIITNTSATQTYGVAVNPDFYNTFNLSNNRGDEFRATAVSGIDTAFGSSGSFRGSLSDIPPKSSITVMSKSQVRWAGRPGDYRPYHFQTEVVFGAESNGRYPDLRKYNLAIDIN